MNASPAKDKMPLFDVDVQGGINLKKIFGERALAIFIMPPRLMNCGQDL